MRPITAKTFWQTFLAISILIGLLAIFQTVQWLRTLGPSTSWLKGSALLAMFLASVIACAVLLGGFRSGRAQKLFEHLEFGPLDLLRRSLFAVLALGAFLAVPYIKIFVFARSFRQFLPLLCIFWWLTLLQTFGWKAWLRSSWAAAFALAILFQGVAYQVYENLCLVTPDPFSISYSETSRFYYGSLWVSQSLYGMTVPLSPWHATRYILLAIPFLVRGLPLWAHRLWQAMLWIGMTAASSWLLVRRLRLGSLALAFCVACWSFIYLLQGPVYYYLQVCVVLVLWGVAREHPWRSLIAVLAASFWAGMSGVNWYPVPAALGAALYLLEQPVSESPNIWRYLVKPLLWGVVGLGGAFAGQAFYILISGYRDLSAFHSSLDSALLWNRLFPSPAFPLGILPGIILISLPLWLGLWFALRGALTHLHPIRWIGLGLMLLILFLGCLAVSVKIGGGADLHDMDSYEVLLEVIALYFFANQVRPESGAAKWGRMPWPVLVLALVVPFAFPLDYVGKWITYDDRQAQADIKALQAAVAPAAARGGEVLFISERQLITFGYVKGVPLVADDELVALMEFAMSENRPALSEFYSDLHQHRFALIVSRKLNTGIKTGAAFSEENNAWNQNIAAPILCEYKPVLSLPSNNLQVYAPRSGQAPSCP
ncbi:MAG TPA: hypothetical protein VLZ89_09090 [Anaerolineales bacterium]|nr:hypothetical protein [Anaerolineales bacterium]